MKRSVLIAASIAVTLCIGNTPAFAQRGRGGAPGGSHAPGGSASSHGTNASDTHGSGASTSSSPSTVLSRNTKLDSTLTSKLQSKGLLPAGTDLKTACAGFSNLGQCIAAVHVSHNLNIPFACLKADMTGTAPAASSTCPADAGTSKMNLGKSIQTLSPNTANAKTEAKKASKEADNDIKESESASNS